MKLENLDTKLFGLAYKIVELAYSTYETANERTYLESLSKEFDKSFEFAQQLLGYLKNIRQSKQGLEQGARTKGWMDDEIRAMMLLMQEASAEKIPVKQAFAQMEHILFKDKTAIWTQYYVVKRELKEGRDLEQYLIDRHAPKTKKEKKSTTQNKEKSGTRKRTAQRKETILAEESTQIEQTFVPEQTTHPVIENESLQEVSFLPKETAPEEIAARPSQGEDLLHMLSGFVKNMQILQPRLSDDSAKSTVLDMFKGLYQLSAEAVAAATSESEKQKYEQTIRASEEEKRMLLEQWEKEKADLKLAMQKEIENLSQEHTDTKQKLINLVRTVQQFEEGSAEDALINLPEFLASVRYQLDKMGYRPRKRTIIKVDNRNIVTEVS